MVQEYPWRLIVQLRGWTALDCRNEASFKSILIASWDVEAVLLLLQCPVVVLCLPAPFGYRSYHVYSDVRMYAYAWRMTTSN
jgi:hypothetical protein